MINLNGGQIMLENKEIWKDCKGYEGKYQVSNFGRVWNVNNQKYLKPWISKGGYYLVNLMSKNGKIKHELIHRLVAIAFIDNPCNYPQVNHKDEDKTNNCVDNLEWCNSKYNNNYGTRNKRISEKLKGENHYLFGKHLSDEHKTHIIDSSTKSKEVCQIDIITNVVINVFKSMREAERQTGVKYQHIWRVCNHKRQSAGGFIWRYTEEVILWQKSS